MGLTNQNELINIDKEKTNTHTMIWRFLLVFLLLSSLSYNRNNLGTPDNIIPKKHYMKYNHKRMSNIRKGK